MPRYTHVDYAKKLGISSQTLSMGRKRHRVVYDGEGMIDPKHPTNIAFAANQEKNKAKSKASGKKKAKVINAGPKPQKKSRIKPTDPGIAKAATEKLEAETEAKQRKSSQIQVATDLLEFKKARLMGEWIPTALIVPFLNEYHVAFVKNFHYALDNLLTDISARHKITNNEKAEFRKKLIDELNIAVDRGLMELDNALQEAQEEAMAHKNVA